MDDTLTNGLTGLDELTLPLTWDDVEHRAAQPQLAELSAADDHRHQPQRNRGRIFAVAAAPLVRARPKSRIRTPPVVVSLMFAGLRSR